MRSEHHSPQSPEKNLSAPPASCWRALTDSRAHLFAMSAVVFVAALLYYPSLHATWYMDDMTAIVQNPVIRNMGTSLGKVLLPRGLALLSFALNYRFGGTDPFGYHMVNLGLHIGCGVLVYLLLRQALREGALLPALGALLFVAHPLQTQAVVYIVQRMAVLAALFFLLSLWLFARARERLAAGAPFASAGHLGYYLGALVAGLCAVFTKENTAVLPVALYLYVIFLLPPAGDRRRLLLSLLPFAAGPLALAAVRLFLPLAAGESLVDIANPTLLENTRHITPLHYLVTEFSVLWVYIRMLFLPYGQALDHSYPVATGLFELRHLAAGAGLALLGALAVRLRRSQPLIAAGIAWFFLALAVESSVIPLDPLFEHRLYLPMFGFVLVLLGLQRLLPCRLAAVAVMTTLILLYAPLSWQRNRLWADPIAFYQDNLVKVPHSERVTSNLAAFYLDSGRLADAEHLLLRSLDRNSDYPASFINLVWVYYRQGRLSEGFNLARRGLEKYPRSEHLLTAVGIYYCNNGDAERGLQILDQALAINPDYDRGRICRASILTRLGRLAEAEEEFRKAPSLTAADRKEFALVLRMRGKIREAEAELRRTIE